MTIFLRGSSSLNSSNSLEKQATKWVWVTVLSTIGVLTGLAPTWVGRPSVSFQPSPAYAQGQVTDAEIRQYAPAAYRIERERQMLYSAAKRSINPVPANLCSMQNLPDNLSSLCKNFLSSADQIIRESGLPAPRFYEIYVRQESDANLRSRVEREIVRCQSEGVCR